MSPVSKPHRDIKVHVPRHNSQRIGPLMTASVEAIAREERVRVDVSQTALEPSSALAQAIESASDWNSLLMTARAERGPQWDVGTQQFFVDEYSDLYYDPTPLRNHLKDQQNDSHEPSSSQFSQRHQADAVNTPRMTRTNSIPPGGMTPSMSQAQLYGTPQAMASPRHFPGGNQGMGGPYGGMSGIPPAQFYGSAGGDGMPISPMQRGPPPGMGMNPGMGMAPGMGMNPAMGMGLPPDGSMSPEIRRRVTRGMSMDEFGGMHG
ncbi:hypothetical protein K466DRAFT_593925 [Polyporus arcularius HHB13444]|uniref:Uncharacterized protein n=1 Tax=Polyporus arcularius HHB13444 TaxID=1314778 RepID=A0A5C3PW80_9APHY|nr:hypothetical protein K466DRAFT_593925 [Polyporus arcularius HHB13444]